MKKPTENQNIFDIIKKGHARRSPVLKKTAPVTAPATPPAPVNQTIGKSATLVTPATSATSATPAMPPNTAQWQEQVKRMQGELQQLVEQLRNLAKITGIPLTQAIQIPEHFTPQEKHLLLSLMQQREENLEKLVVLPQALSQALPQYAKQKKKKAREENVHTKKTVGKRKKWLSL